MGVFGRVSMSATAGGMSAGSGMGMITNSLAPGLTSALGAAGLGGVMSALRTDPDVGYHFFLEIAGISCVRFKDVGGLKMTTEVERFRTGGNNQYEIVLPKGQKFEDLVIKKGFYSGQSEMYAWMRTLHDPDQPITVRDASLVVLNDRSVEVCRFNFFGAFILEYEGPRFDANAKEIAFESIKIHYDYFEFKPAGFVEKLLGTAISAGVSMTASI